MTAVLLLGAAAAAVSTWVHLRPFGMRAAAPVPSLQHLGGSTARRRRVLPLEERAAWALQLLALASVLAGLWVARASASGAAVVLLDPAAGPGAFAAGPVVPGAAALLGFDGERPRAEGRLGPRLERSLASCSDTLPACLVRAARFARRPVVVVGGFGAGWEEALAQLGQPFEFVRLPASEVKAAANPSPAAASPRQQEVPRRLRVTGEDGAARLLAAGLALAGAGRPPLDVFVEAGSPAGRAGAGGPVASVALISAARPTSLELPGALAERQRGVVFPDPLDLAAGTAAADLDTSLRLLPHPRFRPLLGALAALGEEGGRPLATVAASAADLGRFAHEGALLPLCRALLAALLPEPIVVRAAPPGGALEWRERADGAGPLGARLAGGAAAVGLTDTAPGRYLREDGRVELELTRPKLAPAPPLSDADLVRLGGAPLGARPRAIEPAALLLWLGFLLLGAAALLARGAGRALPASALALGLLALFALDLSRPRQTALRLVVEVDLPAQQQRSLELGLAGSAVAPVDAEEAARCERPDAASPCAVVVRASPASSPRAGADALVFETDRPRVDLLAVRAPGPIPAGTAALALATVRVRGAAGRTLEVRTRPSGASPARAAVAIEGSDELHAVALPVAPLAAGRTFAAFEARIEGAPGAEDARIALVQARAAPPRRLLVAGSPSWEARAAAEALDEGGEATVSRATRVGASVVLAQGAPRSPARELLAKRETYAGLDTLVLVGFTRSELSGAPLLAIEHFLEEGGAVLALGPGATSAPGWPEAPAAPDPRPPGRLEGHLAGERAGDPPLVFTGAAPRGSLALPLGAELLATVGAPGAKPSPWLVGSARGRGRLVVATVGDLWRLSPPAGRGEAYHRVFRRALAWAEAARAGAPVAEASLAPPETGLLTSVVRARLRAQAARERHPFLELEGEASLAAALRRLAPPPPLRETQALREDDVAFAAFAACFALSAVLRRRFHSG